MNTLISPLISGVVAAAVALLGQWFFLNRNRKIQQREKLYGPLRFFLDMISHLEKNRQEIMENDIEKFTDYNIKHTMMVTHVSPINKRIQSYWDDMFELIKDHSGQIEPKHYDLINNFLDGYLKREIIEDGKNILADEKRIDKILVSTKNLRDAILKMRF